MPIFDFFRRSLRPLPRSGRMPLASFLESWDGSADLPDEDLTAKLRYVGGALDGIFSHHGSGGENPNAARDRSGGPSRRAPNADARAQLAALGGSTS